MTARGEGDGLTRVVQMNVSGTAGATCHHVCNRSGRGEGKWQVWQLKEVKCIGGNLFYAHAWREASLAA